MAWGAQTRKTKMPKQSATWGAQVKPGRGEIVKKIELGSIWTGTRKVTKGRTA